MQILLHLPAVGPMVVVVPVVVVLEGLAAVVVELAPASGK